MLLHGPDLHCVGPLAFWDFRNIFVPSTGEGQKNVLHERRASGTELYVKSIQVNGYCITFMKRLDEGLS